MNRRIKQIALLSVLGFIIGTASAWVQVSRETGAALSKISPAAGNELSAASIGGPFSLIDQDGNAVTEKTYADAYRLVFFGFSTCPDVCPTELQKMAATLAALGPDADRIQPLFITTDPERDTPEILKEYVALFHPRLSGLTGSKEQIAAAQDAYKVYAAKIDDPEAAGGITMNHSSFTFFMGPDDRPLAIFSTDDTPAERAAAINHAIHTQ